jgi:predicted O-methyltransferase YrrM
LVIPLSRAGTVIVADNVIRDGLVMEATPPDANAKGARAFNAAVAAHPRLASVIVPIVRDTIDGISISVVK